MVAMQATPSFTRDVCAAMAPNSGMHSSRGLLKMLSPTQIASMAPLFSAWTAMSISSRAGVPLVTSARLDKVRPKVVFVFHGGEHRTKRRYLSSAPLKRLELFERLERLEPFPLIRAGTA